MYSIVIMSCDKYKCLTPASIHCLNKNFPTHLQVNIIYGNDCWTKRLREGLEKISDEYVLFLLDDMLIREPINLKLFNDAWKVLKNDSKVAVVNFEKNYRAANEYSENWLEQKQNQMYLHSCQPSLWRRTALIENLTKDEDAWSWEMTRVNNDWKYLINKNANIIEVGRTFDLNWGIARGRLTDEFKNFLIKENIYTNEIKEVFHND